MPDSEKLMALKKAYADIILNTAKEAAARIMVSERKATRYQRELSAAKDDALRMLLRLKQMLDAKVNEAQVTSLCQQRKIEELEAQLGEAEDIVKDLRAELREAQEELENATKNQMQLMNEQNPVYVAAPVTTSQDNIQNASEIMVSSLPDVQSQLVSTSDVDLTLNGMNDSNKCHSENGSHMDNCFFCNSDFASIVMRRKEPKLYRNGCTQRIRACERNLIDGNFSLPRQIDDVKNGTSTGENEEDASKNLDPQPDEMCEIENKQGEVKTTQADSNCISIHAVKSFLRKRKRAKRRRNPEKVIKRIQEPDLSCSETFATAVNDSVLDDFKFSENKAEKDPESPSVLKEPSDTSKTVLRSGCEEVTGSELEYVKACTVQTTKNKDKSLIDTVELTRQESESAQSSEVPPSKTDLETVNVSLVDSDSKASTFVEVPPTQSLNDKFIKYTFQRKRKKDLMSSTDWDSSVDESMMKRKMEEKQNDFFELQNSSLITESPRDNRRVVQVARQLISLSGKKLW